MSRQSRHGEARFSELCQAIDARADATLNKASDDLHGWDYVVDIAPVRDEKLPSDLQTHLFQCFAQIKTTNGKNPSTKLKLSNAIKAAKSTSPSFVFLFHYRSPSLAPVLYGRHVWKDEIFHWLKRARKTEENGRKDLHKLTVSMVFTEKDRIEENPTDWMLDKLVAQGGEEYAGRKLGLVSSVGYEKTTHEGTVIFGPMESIEDIVSHEIGLLDDLPIRGFRLHDLRFGIKSVAPVHQFDQGRISISREGRALTLQLISPSGRTFDVPALAWVPSLVGVEDPEFRFRVKAGHIDMIIARKAEKQSIDFGFDFAKPYSLLEQLGFLCLLSWAQLGAVEYKLFIDRGVLQSGKINANWRMEPRMQQFEIVGHHILEILGGERCQNIMLPLSDFENFSRVLHVVATVYSAGTFRFEAEFEREIEPFEKLIGYAYGQVGDWAFGVIYEFQHVGGEGCGLKRNFPFSNPRIVHKSVFKQPLKKAVEQIQRDFDDYRRKQSVPTAVLQNGDLIAWGDAMLRGKTILLDVK